MYQKWQLFLYVSIIRSNVAQNVVLYNTCGHIFHTRVIGSDTRRMKQICDSFIVHICSGHICDPVVLPIFVPKERERWE